MSYVFSGLAIISAVLVIGSRNPIHSVLALIMVFFNTAALLLLLEVEFLAMIFLVVYVGAIAVLFLFVVMMLNINLVEMQENWVRYLPVGGLIGIIFLLQIFLILDSTFYAPSVSNEMENGMAIVAPIDWINYVDWKTNIQVLGNIIFTDYWLYFILSSVILLVAMIGAIILTLTKTQQVKRQDIYYQLQREVSEAIIKVPSTSVKN